MSTKRNSGFTLIEAIIYIALFGVLMSSGFVIAFELIKTGDTLAHKAVVQDETSFVLRKINWALTGTTTGVTILLLPSAATPFSNSLVITKANPALAQITIRFNQASSSIEMQEGSAGAFMPLTTSNVKISTLQFRYEQGVNGAPGGVIATTTINGIIATTTEYFRK